MTNRVSLPKQVSSQSEDDDENQQSPSSSPPSVNAKLSIDQGEARYITISEAVGLNFNSFIPQADITSQVHFVSNIQPDSQASLAGLKDGDRILQVNGVNVTNLEHEDVRKLMQLMTPIVFTVASDQKYLYLLQQPTEDIEEKIPEALITPGDEAGYDPNNRRPSQFQLRRRSSALSITSVVSSLSTFSTRSHRYETFDITDSSNDTNNIEPLRAKLCRLRKSKFYDGYGLVLKHEKHLHIIGQVEHASPSYRAGLRENDVIIFVGKTNVEKMSHDEVKIMIRAMALTTNHVELTVIFKGDLPRYKTLQEKGFINWSIMGLER